MKAPNTLARMWREFSAVTNIEGRNPRGRVIPRVLSLVLVVIERDCVAGEGWSVAECSFACSVGGADRADSYP